MQVSLACPFSFWFVSAHSVVLCAHRPACVSPIDPRFFVILDAYSSNQCNNTQRWSDSAPLLVLNGITDVALLQSTMTAIGNSSFNAGTEPELSTMAAVLDLAGWPTPNASAAYFRAFNGATPYPPSGAVSLVRLNRRPEARVQIFMATDEDEDAAFWNSMRPANVPCATESTNPFSYTNPFGVYIKTYIDRVASANASIFVFTQKHNCNAHNITYHYGVVACDVADADFSNFNATASLQCLMVRHECRFRFRFLFCFCFC